MITNKATAVATEDKFKFQPVAEGCCWLAPYAIREMKAFTTVMEL